MRSSARLGGTRPYCRQLPSGERTLTISSADNLSLASTQCRLDAGAYGACTSATTFATGTLSVGTHTAYVQATDTAGNVTTQSCTTGNFSYLFPGNATTTQLAFNGGLTAVGATTTALAVTGSSTILFRGRPERMIDRPGMVSADALGIAIWRDFKLTTAAPAPPKP